MATPIKLLLTVPNFDTAGSGKVVLKLAERFDRSWIEPHIACLHDRGALFDVVRASGLPIHVVGYVTPMIPRIAGLRGCWTTRRFFKQFDLIHSFNYADDYSEPLAAKFAGTKWVFLKTNMSWGSRAWRLRTSLSNGVIAQNTDMLTAFFPNSPKVTLIPRGVDTNEFRPSPRATALLGELKLPSSARVVLSVAHLVPIKGIDVLIDAFAQIASAREDTWLCLVGDDRSEYGTELKRKASASGAGDRILFTGRRFDVSAFHSIADIFVLPTKSKGEGCPVAVVEAMASGTLSIASGVPGIRDQLADCSDQLFAADDRQALATKLEWALTLPADEARRRVQTQLHTVQQRYTIEQEVAAHEAFYRRVLGR